MLERPHVCGVRGSIFCWILLWTQSCSKIIYKIYWDRERGEVGRKGGGLTSCHWLSPQASSLGALVYSRFSASFPCVLPIGAIHLSSTLILSQELYRHRKQKHSHEHSTQEPALSQESQANDCIMAICGERLRKFEALLCNMKGTFFRWHQEDFQTVTCRWHTPKDNGIITHCPSGRCFPDPLYAILAC